MITEKDTAIVHIKKVMYMIDKLTGNGYRSAESVFVDFLTLSACSYSNVFDLTNKDKLPPFTIQLNISDTYNPIYHFFKYSFSTS